MSDTMPMSERELAEYYNRTQDLSGFDAGAVVMVEPTRRDVTISVRFSAEEIEQLRAAADGAGEKVTAWIRAAALGAAARETAHAGLVEVDARELHTVLTTLQTAMDRARALEGAPRVKAKRKRKAGV